MKYNFSLLVALLLALTVTTLAEDINDPNPSKCKHPTG